MGKEQYLMKTRDYQLDNIKGLMIYLVVVGHVLVQLYPGGLNGDILIRLFYCVIYSFHMPVFVFISGYFSKRAGDYASYAKKVTNGCLLPYLIFNFAYGVLYSLPSHNYMKIIDILSPKWTLWFFLSLFFLPALRASFFLFFSLSWLWKAMHIIL